MRYWLDIDGSIVSIETAGEVDSGRGGSIHAVEPPLGDGVLLKIIDPDLRESSQTVVTALLQQSSDAWFDRKRSALRLCLPVALCFASEVSAGKGEFVGYLMPSMHVAGSIEARTLFERKVRTQIRDLTWRTSVIAALSVSETVARMHREGMLAVDLAIENAFVSPATGGVTLIDVDSFGLAESSNGSVKASVFRPENCPPEFLTGTKSLEDWDTDMDNFCLAVLISRILYEGFHPFGGTRKTTGSSGHFDESTNIKDGLSWIVDATSLRLPARQPPPDLLPTAIRDLFRESLLGRETTSTVRPSAAKWEVTLRQLLNTGLSLCVLNRRHIFSSHLISCPWCDAEVAVGHDPFPASPPVRYPTVGSADGSVTQMLEDALAVRRQSTRGLDNKPVVDAVRRQPVRQNLAQRLFTLLLLDWYPFIIAVPVILLVLAVAVVWFRFR